MAVHWPLRLDNLAAERPARRSKVRSGVKEYEEQSISNAIQKRQQHKERARNPPLPGQQLHPCLQCDRQFKASIGLRRDL